MKIPMGLESVSTNAVKLAKGSGFFGKLGHTLYLFIFFAAMLAIGPVKGQTPGFSKTGGTTVNSNLLNSTNAFKTQFFYLPTDFSATPTAGNINRIYFRNTVASATGTYTNFKVFMGQTAATVFPGTGSLDFFTGLTQVKNSASLTLTGNATAGGWFFIDLDTPFPYDNTRTLIVEVQIGSFTGGISHFSSSSGVVPAHKKIFSSNTAATSGTQDTNGWPNFGIDITPFPACSGAPVAGNAVSSVTTACVGATFELSLTGTSLVTGLTYQWQTSPNGTTGWTDIPGATSNRLTTSQTTTSFYRANVSCGTNTSASGNVQVTTNGNGLTGTLTIDKSSPVSATNYQSFTALGTDLNCRGVAGPVTVNVVSGTGPYNEQLILNSIPGSSATNTITFNGNNNKISFTGTTANRPVIQLNGADFIKIDNFQIEAPDLTTGWGIHFMNGADNNIISNNTITIASTNITEANNVGIFFTNSTTGVSAGNTGSNNIITDNTINGGYTGIYLSSVLTANGANQIKNNNIRNFYQAAIKVEAAKGTLVENNDISRPTRVDGNSFYGIRVAGNSFATIISKNRIHNSHDAAAATAVSEVGPIYFTSADAPAGSENIVKNNLIYNINNTSGSIYAIANGGSDGMYIYHNTIGLNNASSTVVQRGFYQVTAANNVRFINNIVGITAGTGAVHGLFYETPASVIISDNNDIYVPTGNVGSFAATNRTTMADWKAANGGTYDQNSVSANPNFVNAATGNFLPGNSTINNIGQPVAAVTDDITGATRSTTAPDPGAYEFATPTINDIGITSIVEPVSPVAPGNSPVQVIFKNYGSATVTSATITWSVNTVAQTPFTWTGSLPAGASALVNIGNFTFTAGTFNLNVCTSSPNGATDENTTNDCLTVSGNVCAPVTGTFTIDKNSPASATNFQTFAAAIQSISNCGVSGPVTFNVVAGTGPYNEQVIIPAIAGTNAANTVKFEGNGNKIFFSSATAAANRSVIRLDGADFITLNNLSIEAADGVFGWGVHLQNGADNNTISNNTITIASTSTTEANSAGIVFSNSTSQVNVTGNTGANNVVSGNTITGGFKGIHLNGNVALNSNNQLKNNTIVDFYERGITISAARGTLVEGNDIARPVRIPVSSVVVGIMLSDNALATTISKNRIHNTHAAATTLTGSVYGVWISSCDAPVGSENVVKNNLIYNINSNGPVNALYTANSDGSHFYHNTVDLSNAGSTGVLRGIYQSQVASNVRVINNIVSITAGSGTKTALVYEQPTSGITSNNNALYVPTGNVGISGTTPFVTLANWKTANNNAYDQNSVSNDPSYVNLATGNLQPTSGAINNAGQPVAAVTDDITGAPRNATTPDPGAYEFSVIANDAGVIAISQPVVTGCGLSSAETITVTIRNFGTATLTSIPVAFSVNGTVIATETFTGSLSANTTTTYTFTAKANLSVPGPYIIEAKTILPGDGEATNDAFSINAGNATFPTLPVTLDFETPATGLPHLNTVIASKANITESTAASNGTGSTKGLILDGVDNFKWTLPIGSINTWVVNPDNFAGVYFCISPAGGAATDSLWLTLDLKQLYKTVNANTNFRVTVNGTQVGPTYRPPFAGTPINWQKVKVNLYAYRNDPNVRIGLESSVKEAYDNGNGTANLIDNVVVKRRIVQPTGIKENQLSAQLSVFPNPSAGQFNISLPKGKTYQLEVTDLTGKTIRKEQANGSAVELNLTGTAKGIYLLKVTSEGSTVVRKLIVE